MYVAACLYSRVPSIRDTAAATTDIDLTFSRDEFVVSLSSRERFRSCTTITHSMIPEHNSSYCIAASFSGKEAVRSMIKLSFERAVIDFFFWELFDHSRGSIALRSSYTFLDTCFMSRYSTAVVTEWCVEHCARSTENSCYDGQEKYG